MSNVFILLGAGTGNDVAAFKEEYEGDWDIYAWEANPMISGRISKRSDVNSITINDPAVTNNRRMFSFVWLFQMMNSG